MVKGEKEHEDRTCSMTYCIGCRIKRRKLKPGVHTSGDGGIVSHTVIMMMIVLVVTDVGMPLVDLKKVLEILYVDYISESNVDFVLLF